MVGCEATYDESVEYANGSGFIVGSRCASTTKWLLAHDCTGTLESSAPILEERLLVLAMLGAVGATHLIVDVEVSSCVPQSVRGNLKG